MIHRLQSVPGTPLRCLWLALLLCLLGMPSLQAAAPGWDAIDASDLSSTHCTLQADAKAEILLVKEYIDDESRRLYQRIKVYDAEARQLPDILSIDYAMNEKVSDLFARVVKPDGSTREFTRSDFRESISLTTLRTRYRRLTAAFSGVSNGDIIEFRWTRSRTLSFGTALWSFVQFSVPTRLYQVTLKSNAANVSAALFNVAGSEVRKIKDDEILLVAKNLPSFQEEPHGPALRDVRGWYGIFYRSGWLQYARSKHVLHEISTGYHSFFDKETTASPAIKAKVAELLKGASTDDEKLARLYGYCHHEIQNLDFFASKELAARKRKRDQVAGVTSAATFKLAVGYANDITLLFGAMARAAGYQVRACLFASRNYSLNVNHPNGHFFLTDLLVSVKLGDSWALYAPGNHALIFKPASSRQEPQPEAKAAGETVTP